MMQFPQNIKLLKDLPSCPAGMFFKASLNQSFYYLILSDEDRINNNFKDYSFTREEILNNYDFFFDDNTPYISL